MSWFEGDLSATTRILITLSPAIFLVAYFTVGLIIYTIWTKLGGGHRDREMEARGDSVLANMFIRLFFLWVTRPLWFVLERSRIPAAAVTTLSLILAIGAAVGIATGHFALGGWLYLFAGMLDIFDGRLARKQGTDGPAGAALDSVLDRYSDGVVMIGFAWFYRDSWVLLVVLAALLGSMMISYVRARGEGLGVQIKVGVMQRAERILYLGVATALSPILTIVLAPDDPEPIYRLAIIGLIMLALTTQMTAFHRFVHLLKALGEKPFGETLHKGRGVWLRNQTAKLLATAAEFLLMVLLVTRAGLPPWLATMLGCLPGAVLHFTINRFWAFKAGAPFLPQASRYTFVSLTSALLNGGGVSVLMYLPGLDYRLAWVLVRLVVASAWNYPLQRDYVYTAPNPESPAPDEAQSTDGGSRPRPQPPAA